MRFIIKCQKQAIYLVSMVQYSKKTTLKIKKPKNLD